MKYVIGVLLALSMAFAHAKSTVPAVSCSFSDLSGIQSSGFACSGFYEGNILNAKNYTSIATILSDLTSTTWTVSAVEQSFASKIELRGSNTIDFSGVLTGPTVVAVHKGKGNGSDGAPINGTAFYYFNAGTNLDTVQFNLNGSSNAVAFSVQSPVPENSTYAMLMTGLLVVGALTYRRKSS